MSVTIPFEEPPVDHSRYHRPHLPTLEQVGDGYAPAAPRGMDGVGVEPEVLLDLVTRAAYTVPQFNSEWMARLLHLPQPLVNDLLDDLRRNHLLEVLGDAGPFGFRYAISGLGRERAARLMEICGYVGPAPVSLEAYEAMISWQHESLPAVAPEDVEEALAGMVLTDDGTRTAGLAVSSGRSLFVFGPPGNGKTTLGRALHETLRGNLWIPHCIVLGGSIIRLFDPQCHEPIDEGNDQSWMIDQRWVRIRPPLIVGGGETTLSSFELTYSPTLRTYEAPLHLKANCGTLLIDDFGRQRVAPQELINRWIIPLEHQIDFLTLQTGQKFQIPFLQRLIIATNLAPDDVTDPAFLRRMGYRLRLDAPTPEQYAQIFTRYAERCSADSPSGLISWLLDRYRAEGRELRACEPRDLIERAKDLCRFRNRPLELNAEVLEPAWTGYFGNSSWQTGPEAQ